jgi:hypothetical protein
MSSSLSVFSLDELPGLRTAKKLLRGVVGQPGVHAVLFYGADADLLKRASNLLAQSWLCKTPREEGACGECQSCLSFSRDNCPDFQRAAPWGRSSILKGSAIKRTERDPDPFPGVPVQEFFRTRPLMARHKVMTFEQAERMNRDAASALLKTLEEPEPHAKLILETTAISQVLPTILSRCLAVACELPSVEELESRLGPLTESEIVLSGGSSAEIERIRANPELYALLWRLAQELPTMPTAAALVAADRFKEIGEGLAQATEMQVRASNAEALRLLARALRNDAEAVLLISEAHRRIIGNASPASVFDWLFTALLSRRWDAPGPPA